MYFYNKNETIHGWDEHATYSMLDFQNSSMTFYEMNTTL